MRRRTAFYFLFNPEYFYSLIALPIVKKNEEKLSGIIASVTPAAITLHNIGAQEIIVSRSDIKTLEASETSAMPVGLEASLSVKEMADILAFLKNIH